MSETKKKTPSPNVIAAQLFLQCIEIDMTTEELTEHLTQIASSRVNDAKSQKVMASFVKLTKKLEERARRTVDKFENPPPKDSKKQTHGFKKKTVDGQ